MRSGSICRILGRPKVQYFLFVEYLPRACSQQMRDHHFISSLRFPLDPGSILMVAKCIFLPEQILLSNAFPQNFFF